jgi:hypothetical protein
MKESESEFLCTDSTALVAADADQTSTYSPFTFKHLPHPGSKAGIGT